MPAVIKDKKLIFTLEVDLAPIEKELQERVERSSSYNTERQITDGLSSLFIKEHGKELVGKLKEKMMVEWVEVFRSKVLSKALREVMNDNKDY